MSTTDRAAFEQYAQSQGCNDFEYDQDDGQRYRNPFTQREYKYWRAALDYQAATEAAKVTGTAGELPPLPKASGYDTQWRRYTFTEGEMRAYGQQCAEAARQPAPALPVKTWRERLREKFPETAHSNLFTVGHLEHAMEAEIAELRAALLQIQENSDDISAHLEAKNNTVRELRAALAATAAPVLQPHYRMSEKPKAWLHTLPEGKFFNSGEGENSQLFLDGEEATDECNFHGGTLTPLFTAEWTQAGLDYVNEKADELHKKIVGSQP